MLALAGAVLLAPAPEARAGGGPIIALVTSEMTNQLVAVDLPSGRIVKRLRMPADPQNVAVCGGTAAVVSVRAGAVTLVDTATLRVRRVLRGFGSPHIPACSLDGHYIYVTDDARGQLAVIRSRVVRKLFVGFGAHHIAVSPDQPRMLPAGSFNVSTFGSFVITSSLTTGTVTELSDSRRVLLDEPVAPSARDVAVTTLP